MNQSDLSTAQQIARVARAFEHQITGRLPSSVIVVLREDALVITLHGILSPAEAALAENREGAAQLREFHRQLFTTASQPLREEVERLTGVEVRAAAAEVETSTGTVVQTFALAQEVPTDTWSGRDPEPAAAQK